MTDKPVEKIVRAKIQLEGKFCQYSNRCMVDMDPDYYGPCTCGAGEANSRIQAALGALKL